MPGISPRRCPRRRTTLGVLLGASLAFACAAPLETVQPKRVVLVTIDTLRADHLGSYGNPKARTPRLDALASEGVRFVSAFAPTPLTLPSHASLMTALNPPRHGVRNNAVFALPESLPTLAEGMSDAGFATAAVIGAMVLDRQYGLARGFDHYDDDLGLLTSGGMQGIPERSATHVTNAALAWLDAAPEQFFLWLHYYDPHFPYVAPFWRLSPDLLTRYAEEISYVDTELGRVLDAVREEWPGDDTLFVVTSDHGESLGQHGEPSHGMAIYDSTQRIPLILAGAGLPRGSVVSTQVRLVDVAPTVLALAGGGPLGEVDGRDLLPVLSGEEQRDRPAYLETLATQLEYGWSPLLGLRSDRFKYVRAPRPELYDLRKDPEENDDVALEQGDRVVQMDRQLEAHLERAIGHQRPSRSVSEEERRLLEGLGYLVPSSEPSARDLGRVGGEDPKDKLAVRENVRAVTALFEEGRLAEALELLDGMVDESSSMISIWGATTALAMAAPVRAEGFARRVIELQPQRFDGHDMLGQALLGQGRLEEARAAFEASARLNPELASPWLGLGAIRERSGDLEGAAEFYERAVRARAANSKAVVELAALRFSSGREEEASALLEPLSRHELNLPEVAERLARAQARAGHREVALERVKRALRERPDSESLLRARSEILEGSNSP